MLIVVLLWLLVSFVFLVIGYSVLRLTAKISKQGSIRSGVTESFFMGFLTLSVLTGYLSIWFPLGNAVLIIIVLISIILFILNYKGIILIFKNSVATIKALMWWEIGVILFILSFVLLSVAQQITWGDTESYHVQAIKWIKQYAVVPGLGNIHGRFAFNSMFFVISSLFSFRIGDILIFPLNGICYSILVVKLIIMFNKEIRDGSKWKAVFYGMTLLISLMFLIPNLNSLSTDAICGTIIMYMFTLIIETGGEEKRFDFPGLLLVCMSVFSCIAFKISSLFIVVVLILVLNRRFFMRSLLVCFIGIIILTPFIVRNYYLSGYPIYPFPSVDVFNPDWKIPYENVLSMKIEIEGWAKMSSVDQYPEILNMKVNEWILPWFKSQSFISRLLLVINSLSIPLLVVMLFRKDFFLAKIQFVVIINLIFWFFMAPDIRFVYGFLFTGFSLVLAYIIKLIEDSSFNKILKLITPALICVLLLVTGRRIEAPADTLKHPLLWIAPAPFRSVETEIYATNFEYRVPLERGACHDTEIPCVPYPFDNVMMRSDKIQDGFRVDTSVYSGIHYID